MIKNQNPTFREENPKQLLVYWDLFKDNIYVYIYIYMCVCVRKQNNRIIQIGEFIVM